MAMDAQTLAEVKRKAALGIAMTNASADKRAVYDQTKLATNKEIQRKAENGIALTNPNSAANNSMYEGLVAAKANNMGAQSQIDALNKAKLDQTMAALDKSRNAGLSNLAAEKSAIQPKYYDARNQTAAGSQQQARNFAEFMAARGGTSSGSNAQAELTRGMQLQGNLGALGQQEAAAYGDIERRTSDLQNAYQSDVASAKAGIESERMQAMLTDYYNKQQQELQVAQMMGVYKGEKTAAQTQQEWNNRFEYGNAIGQFSNGQQTLGNKQFQEGIRQDNRNFQYTQGRDKVADAQWQTEFNRIKDQDGIQNALAWANQSLNAAEFEDSSAYKWAGLDAELAAAASEGEKYQGMSANDVVNNVRKNFDDGDGGLLTDTASRDQMYMQIIGAGLPQNQEDQALAAIGFTPDQIKKLDDKYLGN